MEIIFFLWQLPQNIFGFILSRLEKAFKRNEFGIKYYATKTPGKLMKNCAISLGEFIIVDAYTSDEQTVRHEHGHQKQSRILGPLYLLVIGIPSAIGNFIDRVFHKKWNDTKRLKWYYNLPWEHWADKLGKVDRKI